MSQDATHRVVGKYWEYGRDRYEVGDACAPPESALAAHPNRFEPLPDDYHDDDPDDEPVGSVDPMEFTVNELADHVADVDDPEYLEALLDLERASDDRVGAVDAVESRLAEVTE